MILRRIAQNHEPTKINFSFLVQNWLTKSIFLKFYQLNFPSVSSKCKYNFQFHRSLKFLFEKVSFQSREKTCNIIFHLSKNRSVFFPSSNNDFLFRSFVLFLLKKWFCIQRCFFMFFLYFISVWSKNQWTGKINYFWLYMDFF